VQISQFKMIQPYLFIAIVEKKGRGVFTRQPIEKDTILEVAPVIVMSLKEKKLLDQTLLHDYIFLWGEREQQCCMALGWVPVYNHSYNSNCEYEMNYETNEIAIIAMRAIGEMEELTINYNGDGNNKKPVWFPVKE
jgi:SET domain-containing protein